MRIGEVIGNVTLNRVHPSLAGAALRLAVPLTLAELSGDATPAGEALVVYDELGAGLGSRIDMLNSRAVGCDEPARNDAPMNTPVRNARATNSISMTLRASRRRRSMARAMAHSFPGGGTQ